MKKRRHSTTDTNFTLCLSVSKAVFLIAMAGMFFAGCFFPSVGYSQHDYVTEDTVDINKDNYMDTLRYYFSPGTWYKKESCTLINGKTGDSIHVSHGINACEIFSVIKFPEALNKASNKPFEKAIMARLCKPIKTTPDPSLQWILDNFKATSHKDLTYFENIKHNDIEWHAGDIKIPRHYGIPATAETMKRIYGNDISKGTRGMIEYYPAAHKKITETGIEYKGAEILITHHGIILKKENAYAWVFIKVCGLTGNTDKLRWRSVNTPTLIDKYLFTIEKSFVGGDNWMTMINLETGKWGQVKLDAIQEGDSSPDSAYEIRKDSLVSTKSGHNKRKATDMQLILKEFDAN